jgi:glycosyltransferase involved in cell wall biosynthesis
LAEQALGGKPGLLVFSDDWGRHPSSCQHLVRRLLGRYPVWWVNTIGMRRPRLDWATCRRAWEKIYTWFGPNTSWASPRAKLEGGLETAAALTVLSPWMWPWFSTPLDRRINRVLLLRALEPVVRRWPGPVVGVTTLPIVADLMGALPVARWVYYCVDDFSRWPGLDHQAIEAMEQEVIRRADLLIAASQRLQDRLGTFGRSARLLTHGVELEHWRPKTSAEPETVVAGLDRLERPWIVFWGLVDRRMDVDWLARLAADLDRGSILLVGPTDDPDPRLMALARVHLVGPVDYHRLPRLAHLADVLIMPYADLPVTRAMQPLKLLEYLATGKPVVVRRLPSTQAWADALDEAETAEEFSAMVRRRWAEGLPADQAQARRRLEAESWEAKAQLFERWILEGLGRLSGME